MLEEYFPVFTADMKKTHKILIPMMLEPHFVLICKALCREGYDVELLDTDHGAIAGTGQLYTHNDMCYPAILVIGQFIDALKSGKYDPQHTALLLTQTGGGCRASNYIHLLRKALVSAGFESVPVISLNALNIDGKSGFHLSKRCLLNVIGALLYGDFLLCVYNQARSYEKIPGQAQRVFYETLDYLEKTMTDGGYLRTKKQYAEIMRRFKTVELDKTKPRPRVGIVGEIYMKYAPLGNNGLEKFLISQGAEPVVSGLMDFILYCIKNGSIDHQLYNTKKAVLPLMQILEWFLEHKQRGMIKYIKNNSDFAVPEAFSDLMPNIDGIIGKGVKMGEGWLLTAEMVSLIKSGVTNIVCAQPFGCLPNHIVAKGVMGKVKTLYPYANIVAIDYDPGASRINQENRLKLMLMNSAPRQTKAVEKTACAL